MSRTRLAVLALLPLLTIAACGETSEQAATAVSSGAVTPSPEVPEPAVDGATEGADSLEGALALEDYDWIGNLNYALSAVVTTEDKGGAVTALYATDGGWRAVLFDYPYFEREYRIDPTGTRVLKNPGGPGTLVSKARFAQLDKVAHLVLPLFNAFGAVEKTGDTSQLRLTLVEPVFNEDRLRMLIEGRVTYQVECDLSSGEVLRVLYNR